MENALKFAEMIVEAHGMDGDDGIMDEILEKLTRLRRRDMRGKNLQVGHAKTLVRDGKIRLEEAMILVFTLQDLEDYGY